MSEFKAIGLMQNRRVISNISVNKHGPAPCMYDGLFVLANPL